MNHFDDFNRVGRKISKKTNRARCGSTGVAAPGSVNFFTAEAVTGYFQTALL